MNAQKLLNHLEAAMRATCRAADEVPDGSKADDNLIVCMTTLVLTAAQVRSELEGRPWANYVLSYVGSSSLYIDGDDWQASGPAFKDWRMVRRTLGEEGAQRLCQQAIAQGGSTTVFGRRGTSDDG